MAKQKTPKIELNVSGEFEVHVPEENLKAFQTSMDNSELALSIEIPTGDGYLSFSIYSDKFKNGGMTVSMVNANACRFELSGQVEFALDLSIMRDEFDYLNAHKDVPAFATYVFDQDMNYYYIDGDEDKNLNIGTVNVVN